MSKLSERDICSKFITQALLSDGWDLQRSQLHKRSYHRARQAALAEPLIELAQEAA